MKTRPTVHTHQEERAIEFEPHQQLKPVNQDRPEGRNGATDRRVPGTPSPARVMAAIASNPA